MATLHMDVETARSTQSNITNTYQQLTSTLQSMTSAVNGLQPAWMGNSATEFFGQYDQWEKRHEHHTGEPECHGDPPAERDQ